MSAYNDSPELFLSKKRARFLLTRNANLEELYRKKASLIDKAKWEERKAFDREREKILQSQSRTEERIQTPLRFARLDISNRNSKRLEDKRKLYP